MSIRVGIGAGMVPSITPPVLWRWIALCEQSGIDSIWHSDQILGPAPDPIVMMAGLAARTERMRFGMNALVVPFREPLIVAKQIASIDYLSGGRVLPMFGVGADNDPYWNATGRSAAQRGARANEAIALIRALLEEQEVAFDGVHFQYHGPGVQPRPQHPIPLWIGGDSRAAIRRTAAAGDGWIGGLSSVDKTIQTVAEIKAELALTGRTIDDDHYGATVPFRIGAPDDAAVTTMRDRLASRRAGAGVELHQIIAAGEPEVIVSHIRTYVAAGISKFVALPVAKDGEDLLDQTNRLARDVIPHIESLELGRA
ncbi:LLM class flavin-dependent oxidoreductase [Sphingobium mellinum]|uniref:LLM class flavin-dependent oxidoreductase n=1 Tax=Sphingobium mellinum TaxID=1387166 RepID=UPI0030EEB62C